LKLKQEEQQRRPYIWSTISIISLFLAILFYVAGTVQAGVEFTPERCLIVGLLIIAFISTIVARVLHKKADS